MQDSAFPEVRRLDDYELVFNRGSAEQPTGEQLRVLGKLVRRAGKTEAQFIQQAIGEWRLHEDCARLTRLSQLTGPEVRSLYVFRRLLLIEADTRPNRSPMQTQRRGKRHRKGAAA